MGKVILPRQESFASLHILTRRASEGSEALPSLARRVRMSFFGARVIGFKHIDQEMDRRPGFQSYGIKNCVERQAISLEDVRGMVPMVVLQIVNEDEIREAAGEIPPGREGDFRVFVGNQLP